MSLRLHTGGETRSCTIRCHWTPPPPPPPPPHLSLSTCQLHSTTCSGVFGGFRGGLWSLTFPLLADHRKAFGCEEGVHECKFSHVCFEKYGKKILNQYPAPDHAGLEKWFKTFICLQVRSEHESSQLPPSLIKTSGPFIGEITDLKKKPQSFV